jgi:hypothetical protein
MVGSVRDAVYPFPVSQSGHGVLPGVVHNAEYTLRVRREQMSRRRSISLTGRLFFIWYGIIKLYNLI